MIGALAQITARQWRLHKLRLLLTTFGIALGVAVFFAIQTTNKGIVGSLHSTIEKLGGRSTLQVTGDEAGFSLDNLRAVRETPGVQYAEPVTETNVTTVSPIREKLLILGLDTNSDLKIYSDMFDESGLDVRSPMAFTSRSDSIAVTKSFAGRFGLKDGSKLILQTRTGNREFTVRGFFRSTGAGEVFGGNVAVMDIAATREIFGRGNRIDRIDLTNKDDVSIEELRQDLASILPAGLRVVRPEFRGQGLENAVSSMNFGLTLTSFLGLTICGFIIFNSFSISVNQRWKEIGILRALGVERRNVQLMFLGESLLMGAIGSAIGIIGGYYLARLSLRVVMDVTSTVYGLDTSPTVLDINYTFAAEAFGVGMIASLVAAWLPARSAANLDPAAALHNIETRQAEKKAGLWRPVLGSALVIAAMILTWYESPRTGANIQFIYCLMILSGMLLLLPKLTELGSRALRPFMDLVFGAEGVIAVETMARSPRRTISTVGALMIGLSFVFAIASLIQSQKVALNRMIDKALGSDMMVTSSDRLHSRTYHFTEEAAHRVISLPEVAVADGVRVTSTEYGGDEVTILAHDMDAYFAMSPGLLDTGNPETARAATSSGAGVLISNNLGLRFNLGLGDVIRLKSPTGTLELPVVGMLDYYRSEKGTIFLDRSLYKRYWADNDVDGILINLKPDADRAAFKNGVQAAVSGEQTAFVYTHEEYKQWVMRLIDQFFSLLYIQMVFAIFVAAIGLINTMLISVAERTRELGIFRAIGGYRRQVVKMVLLEAVAISLIGLATGVVAGLLNAYFLVNTAAKIVAGFNLQVVFPVIIIVAALPFTIVVAMISAWLPARAAARLNVAEAIGFE
jgi:putative ABC transport system permease protein